MSRARALGLAAVGSAALHLALAGGPAAARAPEPRALVESVASGAAAVALLDSIAAAPSESLQTKVFYRFLSGLESGGLRITTPAEARRLAECMAQILVRDTSAVLVWQAAEMLAKHPHPAATEALLSMAARPGPRYVLARSRALEALVSLGDLRALPLLRARLANPIPGEAERAARLLAELGDRRGLEPLVALQADTSLERRIAGYERARGIRPDRVDDVAAGATQSIREGARRAERDLRRRLEEGVYSAFDLEDSTYLRLVRQGFAITTETGKEMYEFLGAEYPAVTSDCAFHAVASLVRAALMELDSLVVEPRLAAFCREMLEVCCAQARDLPAGAARDAARDNAELFAVAVALLDAADPEALGLPDPSLAAVRRELEAIRAHRTPGPSLLPGGREDFTKYLPRGRFSGADQSAAYFQAVTFLGRATFRYDRDPELRRAAVMTAALAARPGLLARWAELDSLLGALYGPPDDATFTDVLRAADTLGEGRPERLAGEDLPLARLRAALAARGGPRIHTGYADEEHPGRRGAGGVRILGQRYTCSADLFQSQMEAGIWPPSGLAVAGLLMGSQRARELMPAAGLRSRAASVAPPARGDGPPDLPQAGLRALSCLFRVDPRAPAFMHRPPWEEKQINAALGGWAEMLDLTAPFVKDANVYLGISSMVSRFHGWVEPVPEFYARLDTLVGGLGAELARAGLFAALESSQARILAALPVPPPQPGDWSRADYEAEQRRREAEIRVGEDSFSEVQEILRRLRGLAEKGLRGEAQTIDDGFFLKDLGGRLKRLALNRSNSDHAPEAMAVIADPATEYLSGECLQVGVGLPHAIYVAVPDAGRTFVCRGPVYSYYEFTRPIGERLDDVAWRALLKQGGPGVPAPWMAGRPALRPTEARPGAHRDVNSR